MVPKNSTEVRASENDGIDIYDIDVDSSDATFASLLAVKKYIVCYFSAGIMEFSRADTGCFNNKPGTGDYGCNFGGAYKDEFWLNTSSIQVRRIMQDRIDKAAKKHCSAIDPDNVDAFSENQNGIGATVKDSISFIQFLADEAHSRGMGIGLKNAIDLLPNVSSKVDFAVNEQCMQHEECDKYTDFLKAGHPVVNIEYPAGPEDTNVERSFAEAEADARCTAWQGLGLPKLATTLKGYPTISCGVSRCVSDAGVGKALPAVPSSGPLPIPDGCVDQ
jgi:hypothetical protein